MSGPLDSVEYVTRGVQTTLEGEQGVYARTTAALLPGYNQEALMTASVLCIGAGGLGGAITRLLVRKGIGALVIVDGDTVATSNLNRQYFFPEDRYQPKAAALAKNLSREATGNSRIVGIPMGFQEALRNGALPASFSLALCGVDNDQTRIAAARHCRSAHTPCIFMGVSKDAVLGYCFIQENGEAAACFACRFPDADASLEREPCGAGATPDILSAIAGCASYAVDSLLMPDLPRAWNYKEVFLSGTAPESCKNIVRRPTCTLCACAL